MSYVLVLRDRHAARSGVIDVLVVQNGVSSSGNVGNFFQVIIKFSFENANVLQFSFCCIFQFPKLRMK